MQRASLRRFGVWAVIAAVGGASGCGDDLPGVTTEGSSGPDTDSTGGSTPTTGDPDTSVTTGDPTPTGDDSETDTTSEDRTTGEPTTGDIDTGDTDTGGANQLPVALGDVYFAKARQALTPSPAEGVLKNDFDPDGDPLVVIAGDPVTANGAKSTMFPDGSFTYLPPDDLWGDDSFTYKIYDSKDGFASAMARVSLSPTAIPLEAIADGKHGFVINGEAADDYSGRAVHRIGDVNQDGLGDLLVASPSAADNTGRAYVVFGKTTGAEVALGKLEDSFEGFVILGEAAGDVAGASISGAGDVNGDGRPDILIGAPKANTTGNSSGSVYVVFGKSDSAPVLLELVTLGEGGFSIDGEAAQHFAGQSVRGAGDVNGDGLADIVLGAYGAEPNGILSGRAYVVYGRDAGKPTSLASVAMGLGEGFAINGAMPFDFAGSVVDGAGDVNGDGLGDVIVGSYGSDEPGDTAGRAYVVFGKAEPAPVELAAVAGGAGGFVIEGEQPFDVAGSAVAGAGDVNGDGLADVLVGAPLADTNGEDAGRSYLIHGKPGGEPVALAQISQGVGGFAIDGQQSRDYSGFSLGGAGDVNGDGLDDVIVGAYGANPSGDASGRSYVVFGKPGTEDVPLFSVANGDGGFAIDGEMPDDYSGFSVAGAGDVDGDGYTDVIVGAFGSDAKGEGAGRSYVVFGGDYSDRVRISGGPGPDNLAGTAGADLFVTGRGDDLITGMGGADIYYTGAGDDTVRIDDPGLRRLDGGEGEDSLVLQGAGLVLDLSTRPDTDVVSVEVIELGAGGHTLVLARRDLLALVRLGHQLTVEGSSGSVEADLGGGGFQDLGVVDGYQVFSDGVTSLRIAAAIEKNVTL